MKNKLVKLAEGVTFECKRFSTIDHNANENEFWEKGESKK